MAFFIETLFNGLMAGMLYALVALGFVLIFKASGVFNFAQGAMVLFAALAGRGARRRGAPGRGTGVFFIVPDSGTLRPSGLAAEVRQKVGQIVQVVVVQA